MTASPCHPEKQVPVKCVICKTPLEENQRKPLLQFFICADGMCEPEPVLSRMDDPSVEP